jgi:tetratricopeptide (TPR) repeat protein
LHDAVARRDRGLAESLLEQLERLGPTGGGAAAPATRSYFKAALHKLGGDYRDVLAALSDVDATGVPARLRMQLLVLRSEAQARLGDAVASVATLREAVAVGESSTLATEGPAGLAVLLDTQAALGYGLFLAGQVDEAWNWSEAWSRSVADPLTADLEVSLAAARHFDTLGHVACGDSTRGDATALFERSRAIRLRSDNPRLLSISEANLGIAAAYKGDWVSAAERFRAGLALHRTYNDPYDIAVAHVNLAESYIELADFPAARAELAAASELAEAHHLATITDTVAGLTARCHA